MVQAAGGPPYGQDVARILRAIPSVWESAISPPELAGRAGLGERGVPEVEAVMAVLGVLGVLDRRTDVRGEPLFRAATSIAHGCIRSLAEHLDQGLEVFLNWGRAEAGADAPVGSAAVLSGPRFLFAIESHRFAERGASAPPLAGAEIAQAVIKERAAPGGESRYLVQYDSRSRQYQLIGGHRRPDDRTIEHAIVRELEEELTDFSLDHDNDALTEIQRFERLMVSRTSGVLTRYRIVVFHLRTRRERIVLGPADRWVSERELNSGRADDGRRILFSAPTGLAGGLAGLEPTVVAEAGSHRWGFVRRHPWETMGLILGVLGLAVSFLQLL
ncbi:NUDIX domain-containing protein [Streptomyces microflavus]|uniref:NUDIX domain-containing protein n=1 Tax=Streptomyces microflavus TaxID=1919 RepID=UPI0036E73848